MEGMLASNTEIVLEGQTKAMDGEERCCHLLGCDIMFDEDGKAWMLEVSWAGWAVRAYLMTRLRFQVVLNALLSSG